eukprot:3009981-Amphidinium_carterae.1
MLLKVDAESLCGIRNCWIDDKYTWSIRLQPNLTSGKFMSAEAQKKPDVLCKFSSPKHNNMNAM